MIISFHYFIYIWPELEKIALQMWLATITRCLIEDVIVVQVFKWLCQINVTYYIWLNCKYFSKF